MTTLYKSSITVDNVIDALAAFLQPFCTLADSSNAQIIRSQVNRVSTPAKAYVLLTDITQSPLETPSRTIDGPDQQATITTPNEIDVQVDFYGVAAGDWCNAVLTVFRSPYATAQFPDGIAPLYASDGHKGALVTGEEQYESRWVITAKLQYNPGVTIPQQSADTLEVTSIEVLL